MTELPQRVAFEGGSVDLRPSTDGDADLLYRVYASSREHEMSLLSDWSQAQKEVFLREQFRLQHHHYHAHYPNAQYDVIEHAGEPIGRLYIARMEDEIRLMDIALLPEHRNHGIGRALMREVLSEAARERKLVSLHVEDQNPAKRLYERMGFVEAGEVSLYKLMHWTPPEHEAQVKTAS